MVELIWTEPALSDLDAIADYIALDNPAAAKALVHRIFKHVGHLTQHPKMGAKLPEYSDSRYRQVIEPPCRVIYRQQDTIIYVLHVMRVEQLLQHKNLRQ